MNKFHSYSKYFESNQMDNSIEEIAREKFQEFIDELPIYERAIMKYYPSINDPRSSIKKRFSVESMMIYWRLNNNLGIDSVKLHMQWAIEKMKLIFPYWVLLSIEPNYVPYTKNENIFNMDNDVFCQFAKPNDTGHYVVFCRDPKSNQNLKCKIYIIDEDGKSIDFSIPTNIKELRKCDNHLEDGIFKNAPDTFFQEILKCVSPEEFQSSTIYKEEIHKLRGEISASNLGILH